MQCQDGLDAKKAVGLEGHWEVGRTQPPPLLNAFTDNAGAIELGGHFKEAVIFHLEKVVHTKRERQPEEGI